MTDARTLQAAEPEASFQKWVIDCAHVYGWRVASFHVARTAGGGYYTPVAADGEGWPDLFLCHPDRGEAITIECKSMKGELSKPQQDWYFLLNLCHIKSYVFRPSDRDVVERILRGQP